jgi:hypothetical protein
MNPLDDAVTVGVVHDAHKQDRLVHQCVSDDGGERPSLLPGHQRQGDDRSQPEHHI